MIDIGLEQKIVDMIIATIAECGAERAVVFGSRAKGNYKYNSDIDIAVWGLDFRGVSHLASELDELPTPYKYDVLGFESLSNADLREHIEKVGIEIYPQKTLRNLCDSMPLRETKTNW